MENPAIQRVVDAASLILATAADYTERTGCTITEAVTYAKDRTAETYHLTRVGLADAARIATRAAFTTGAYSINAMTNPAIRATALRTASPYLANQDQPCLTRSEPRSREPHRPHRPTAPKTSAGSARHSTPPVPVLRRFANFLSTSKRPSTANHPTTDHA
jgi:hypothetical protein